MSDEDDTLVVLLHRERIGEVTQFKGELRFRYDEAWHAARATGRFSLAGAQAKTALQFDPVEGRWGDPWGAAATTHIFKTAVAGLEEDYQ